MDCSAKISCDNNGLIIENPAMPLTGDAARVLADRRASHRGLLAIAGENDRTPEMRRETSEILRRVARATRNPDVDSDKLDADSIALVLRDNDRVAATIRDRITRRGRFTAGIKLGDYRQSPPTDHSFWWARTDPFVATEMSTDYRNDGLHFWAGPKVDSYDGEIHTSFGAVASFALQPERFPTSPSGKFLSSPHVELFGGVTAYAPEWTFTAGNGIASCRLFLRQTIYQIGFGEGGSVHTVIAEASGYDAWQVYLKNTGYSRYLGMPGFKLIPAVVYNQGQLAPGELWAEVEARLEIYLDSGGALLWCDPEVVLRTYQWEPTPLP